MPESGCAAKVQDDAIHLPPFGTFFAAMTPIGATTPFPFPVMAGLRRR